MLEAWAKLPWPIIIPSMLVMLVGMYFWPRISKRFIKPKEPQASQPVSKVEAEREGDKPKVGIYPAYVWRDGKIAYEKIPEKLGRVYIAETTMPHPGACYLVIETKGGLKAYDPRDVPLPKKGESPKDLYRFLHWPEVSAVYTNISTLWDKINMILPWVAVCGLILVLIVGMDKLAK